MFMFVPCLRSADGMDARSRSESMVRVHQRAISSLLDLELVWNRQRGGRGRLKLSDVVDAVSGPQSQVRAARVAAYLRAGRGW